MVGFVRGGLREDGHKGMGSAQLVVGDGHEERKKFPLDGKQVVVGWFPFKGGKGAIGLFEEAGDGVGHHLRLIVAENLLARKGSIFPNERCWTGAVEDCNDDDQCDGIGKGKLRVFGAFGNSAESVGSRDCDCSSGGFVGIKLELDFHRRER